MSANVGGGFAAELRRIVRGAFGAGMTDPRQERTFEILFRLLGHLARIDGQVTEEESSFVYAILGESHLPAALRERAMVAYSGDGSALELRSELERYLEVFPPGSPEVKNLFEHLLTLANADGRIDAAEQAFLDELAKWLGIPRSYLAWKLQALSQRVH